MKHTKNFDPIKHLEKARLKHNKDIKALKILAKKEHE